MRYEALHCFYTVVNEKSFTSAARKLYLTQPAVSMAIKQLEADFGQPLLERKPGGRFELTPMGEQVYHVVKNINFQMEKLKLIKEKKIDQEIVIECNTIAGVYLISSLASEFQNLNPEIYLNIKLTQDPVQSLLDGKSDLVMLLISEHPPQALNPHLRIIKTWEDKHEIIVSKSHPLAGCFASREELAELPFIQAMRGAPYRKLLDNLAKQLGTSLKFRVELSNPETVKRTVLSLNLLGIVASSTVVNELKEGILCPILNDLDMGLLHLLAAKRHSIQTALMRNFTQYIMSASLNSLEFPDSPSSSVSFK